jgi:predicted 3-demethylubiquinone-9 3-methyltransferase (glyoxalase superfamily)
MRTREKITPHLWYDKEAKEAAQLYTAAFAGKDSRVKNTTTIHDTPSGSADIVTIELLGQEFTLLNAGPLFEFNPSVSFLVTCRTKGEVEVFWDK